MEESQKSSTKSRLAKPNYPQNTFESGKLPPQAIDLEEAVLGALMLDSNALSDVLEILSPSVFYKEAHKKIYKAILDLFTDSEPIDILTVTQKLRSTGELDAVGGPYFVSQLTNRVASSANLEYHARIISQKYLQRELIKITSNITKKAYEDTSDVLELLDEAEQELFNLSEGNIKRNYESMRELLQKAITQIEEAGANQEGLSGVPSGFRDLDKLTGGWQKSDLVIVAARPAMGKTAFVLSMAKNMATRHNVPVALFSLEMSSIQLVNRLISSETGIESDKLRKGNLSEEDYRQLHARIGKLAEAPIYIDDTPALGIFELRAKCRRLVFQHDVKIIIIDYLQLMSGTGNEGGNRVQEISAISRALKIIAKELEVPVIALSQLSRAVETRGGDKRPMLSDLRESGSIEQDADIVSFIYRPEYYGITEDENGQPLQGVGEIMIAKHRNGAVENVRLRFKGHLARFEDLNEPGMMGDGDNPFSTGGGLQPNSDFDGNSNIGASPNVVIKGSKINDDSEDDDGFSNLSGGDGNPQDLPW
ncbi:replicative DNA helicase [Luteibaculum oceani]|uniref:Replicative DNA helicase n=1 Tax=Luteibaculum oceani TaxID=1294296 RepID=A0A5C6V9R4_9FLAO|nr:replicative DNA helicase [Luteibaculum oceani]TXC81550.1 replicative DNA helicase [Luteibaculum oceani]